MLLLQVTTLKNEFLNNLVVLETKNIQNYYKFCCWKHQQKGVISCGEVKNCYIAWRRVFRKANIRKTEVQQDCNPSASCQI